MTAKRRGVAGITLTDSDMAAARAMAEAMAAISERGGEACDECGHLLTLHDGGPIELRTVFSGSRCIEMCDTGGGWIGRCGCPGAVPN